jgi:hypothetical protein
MRNFRHSTLGTMLVGFFITLCVALTLLVVLGAVFRVW